MPKQQKRAPEPVTKVGKRISIPLGGKPLTGKVVEDYGPLAPDGSHIYRIEIEPETFITVTDAQIRALRKDAKQTNRRPEMAADRLKISMTGAIASDNQLSEQVIAANAVLLDVIGKQGAPVYADWSLRIDEKKRTLVVLKLRDHTGEVEVKFAPDELKNPRDRIHRAWGDLLQRSSP